jgi:hypothetical protein
MEEKEKKKPAGQLGDDLNFHNSTYGASAR